LSTGRRSKTQFSLEIARRRDARASFSAFGYGNDCDQTLLSERSGPAGIGGV